MPPGVHLKGTDGRSSQTGHSISLAARLSLCLSKTVLQTSHQFNQSRNSPAGNTVLYHLPDEVRAERLERVANTLLRKDLDELLPEQVEVCADLHLRPYYGDEDDTDGLYHSVAKRGTTAFHAYATLYARVKNKRYTLAVRRLKDGDTASSVLAEFFGVLDGLDAGVKAVYLDRGFYDSKCLTLLQAHNYAYVIPIIRWVRRFSKSSRKDGVASFSMI